MGRNSLAALASLAILWNPCVLRDSAHAAERPRLSFEEIPSAEPIPLPPPIPPLAEAVRPAQYSTESAPAAAPKADPGYQPWSPERWHQFPIVRPTPKLGWFIPAPTGKGYYTVLDFLRGDEKDKSPPNRFGNPYYENDYRFLDKPKAKSDDWGDVFKRRHLGDCWLFTMGGEERLRFVNEEDGRLDPGHNQYQLIRSRVYLDGWYQDRLRVFAEFFDARIYNEDRPPARSDVDHADFLNLFVDYKLLDLDDGPVYLRGGQQELLYGPQRLLSPPDWSNTRRNFRGVKGFYRGDKWDVDFFWARPVIPNRDHFDEVDRDQDFVGLWITHRPKKGQTVDLYYFYRAQRDAVTGFDEVEGGQYTNTFGGRYSGEKDNWLWDFEFMGQFGAYANQDMTAINVTTGLGYSFKHVPWEPTFWIYNDFASGTDDPENSRHRHTFNQLYPLGHTYFGFLDLIARQNINDVNMQLAFRPVKWNTTLLQAHFFYLDSNRDALYNAQGVVLRQDSTGNVSHHVGNEIDILTTFRLSAHHEFSVGFSKFFAGNYVRQTGDDVSPELFYFQYYFRW